MSKKIRSRVWLTLILRAFHAENVNKVKRTKCATTPKNSKIPILDEKNEISNIKVEFEIFSSRQTYLSFFFSQQAFHEIRSKFISSIF